jgi:hypothetical protein
MGPSRMGDPVVRQYSHRCANPVANTSGLNEVSAFRGRWPSRRAQIDLTLPSVAKALLPRTKESRHGRREVGCNGRCRGGSRPLLLRASVPF